MKGCWFPPAFVLLALQKAGSCSPQSVSSQGLVYLFVRVVYKLLVLEIIMLTSVAMTCLLNQRQRQRQVDPVLQDVFEDMAIGVFDVGYLRGY